MGIKKSLSLAAILCVSNMSAVDFKPMGFKATGMGGAGVASTRGSLAGYYNPAMLQFSDHTTELSLNLGARIRESNLVDNMDKLKDIDFEGTMDRIANHAPTNGSNSLSDKNNLITAMDIVTNKIGSKNALVVSATPALAAQISNSFAIGVYASVDVGLQFKIDKNYNQLIFKNGSNYYQYDPTTDVYSMSNQSAYETSSLEYGVDNNKNYVKLDAIAVAEIPISYAKAYDTKIGTFSYGLSLKPMGLTTYNRSVKLGESSKSAEDNADNGSYETKYKSTFGVDAGFAYRLLESGVTLGIVGKNLNTPTFKVDESKTGLTADMKLKPMARAGLSIPFGNDNFELAFDADLTKNETLIEGDKSQYIGGGIEFHPASWFSLRGGAMQDIASERFDEGVIYTAGFGFGLKWLQVDVSAMMSSKSGQYDGNEIPRYAAVNLSLVSKWGDGYNRKTPPTTVDEQNKPLEKIDNTKQNELSNEKKEQIKNDADKAQTELLRSL